MTKVQVLFISPSQTIKKCMAVLNKHGEGIVLAVDKDQKLLATITDGDIRRAMMDGVNIDSPAQVLLDRRSLSQSAPLTAPVGTSNDDLLALMNAKTIRHIPLVNDDGRVTDIALLKELAKSGGLPISAVVMAGGYGTRLKPLTDDLPKPMIPVGGRPIMERIVNQLRDVGIKRVNVTTHYKKEMISEHFGDGHDFGVNIEYVEENKPLGTAGALGLTKTTTDPLLVINGDILTGVDFGAMLSFHQDNSADMTVAVTQHEVQVPHGVIESKGMRITQIVEKPIVRQFVSAGIYLINPEVPKSIPNDRAYDMPELINYLISKGRLVASFPIHEYWFDIGNKKDYERAQRVIRDGNV